MRYDSNTGFTVADLPTATDIVTGASKGTNLASDVTSTSVDANHTGLDVVVPAGVSITPGSTVTAVQGAAGAGAWPVSLASVPSHPVTQGSPPWAVSAASLPLPTGAATETTVAALLARLPTALVGGRLDVNIGAPATLPVSIATMPSTPVTGTFWQATQPVSAASLPLPAGAAQEHITAAGFHAVRLTDGATFYDGRDITDRAARLVGHVTVDNASLPVTQSGTWTVQPGNTTNTTPWLVKSTDNNGLQHVLLAWEEMAGTAAVESALTNATFLTQNMVALTPASTFTVPAAVRFRITNVSCYVKATSTVNNLAKFRIRAVASGSVLNSSPPVFNTVLALSAPGTVAAGLLVEEAYSVPEGSLDFPTGAQLTFTWNTAAATCTVGMTVMGYLYTP